MALAGTVEAIDLPFQEAIDYFAQKANVTTKRWTDVWQEAHTRSFMVAGAATQALVGDFRDTIRKAIETGTTLEEFRKDFDGIVEKRGWKNWTGSESAAGRAWRTRIIYETNLNMAYAAGRYAQMSDPDVLRVFPYWVYRHSGNPHPRLQHKAWDGLTLKADDTWWNTNYPPNGFNCGCTVEPVSANGLKRQGKSGPDEAPPLNITPKLVGRSSTRTALAPEGVDPGFAYNPGMAWRGEVKVPSDAKFQASPGYRPPPPAPPAPPLNVARPVPPPAVSETDRAMTAAYADWRKGLSEAEQAAIAAYKGDVGKAVNAALRRGRKTPLVEQVTRELDAALARATTPNALTVYRGVKDLKFLHGADVGSVVVDDGYVSTSLRRKTAKDFRGDGLLVIDVPEGYNAAYIHNVPDVTNRQYELLIPRGARFEVLEVRDREYRLRLIR